MKGSSTPISREHLGVALAAMMAGPLAASCGHSSVIQDAKYAQSAYQKLTPAQLQQASKDFALHSYSFNPTGTFMQPMSTANTKVAVNFGGIKTAEA